MKLGIRIFLCYLVIFAGCFYYPIDWVLDTLRSRYLEGVEDPLVDHANILAASVGHEMALGKFDREELFAKFQDAYRRPLTARIYKLLKTEVDMRVYITDRSGTVLFDSVDRDNWGADYSAWRDVHLTLKGQYGARTTLADPEDPTSSVLFVAAPVRVGGELGGVLTVAKPTTNIKYFLQQAKPQIFRVGILAAVAAVVLGFFLSVWITRPIKRLTRYADDVREGKRVGLPRLDRTEIGDMGAAFEKMREALAGKQYVEQYVQKLTHEIKSPLSAIRGAAELLEENMPAQQRSRFLDNIRSEAGRIQQIVDHMLELSALENREKLQKKEKISLHALVKTVVESKQPLLSKKGLRVVEDVDRDLMVRGDSFLLHQAVSNLVQNAIDFSNEHDRIRVSTQAGPSHVLVVVDDNGVSIPAFAEDKVFDKFFSLQRPDSGKKSTGLGLNFVKEVAELHGGGITLENRPEGGVRATLNLPL